jgi:O-succinylbenzoic acid--CoA ligase
VGVPDPEWGQAVAAALVLTDPGHPPTVGQVREALRGILPPHALPRHLAVVDALPLRGPGKPDRAVVTNLLATGRPARDTMDA